MRKLVQLCAALTVLVVSSTVWAQQPSLADLARREAERRKAVKESGKVYTNSDVQRATGAVSQPSATPVQKPADSTAPSTAASPTPQESAEAASKADSSEPLRDEAWWRKQMADLTDQLNRSRLFGEALQSRINALWADFSARDDPAQRSVIEKSRSDALGELERVKKEIAQFQQSIEDLEESARKANVPPGWLR
ncbi:MAG: hypothetical protein AB7I50_14550 [Vicinamibacterales bacterium]